MQILLPVERLDRFEELQPNFKGIWDEKGRYLPGFDLKTRMATFRKSDDGEVSKFQIERITGRPLNVIRHDPNKNIVQSVNLGPQSLVDHFCQFVIGRFGLAINTRLTARAINKFLLPMPQNIFRCVTWNNDHILAFATLTTSTNTL